MRELVLPLKVTTDYINSVKLWEYSLLEEDFVVEFSKVENAGMNLFVILRGINISLQKKGFNVELKNVPQNLANYESFFYEDLKVNKQPNASRFFKSKQGFEEFFFILGNLVTSKLYRTWESLFLGCFMLYKSFISLFKRNRVNRGETVRQMEVLGYEAIGIVVLINVLISIVMSLQFVIQLEKFGAGILGAATIGLSMLNEFGPVMTAIILIGRSGSAVTAEVATMNVNEELDGLAVMGVSPVDYVIIPKIWAFAVMGPVLGTIGTFVGIATGVIVGVLQLEVNLSLFVIEMFDSISIADLLFSASKNLVFSLMIVIVAVVQGFRVSGGAEEVGRATTKSVVCSLIGLTILNSLFSAKYF